jgi:hypothetical protein
MTVAAVVLTAACGDDVPNSSSGEPSSKAMGEDFTKTEETGGLTLRGNVLSGVIRTTVRRSSSTPITITIGLRATFGSQIDFTISTTPRLTLEQRGRVSAEISALNAEIRAAEKKIQAQRDAARTQFVASIVAAAITVVGAAAGSAVAGAGTGLGSGATLASTTFDALFAAGSFQQIDLSANLYLSSTLEALGRDLTSSVPAPTPSPSPSPTAPAPLPTVGQVTFGSL